MPTYDTPAPISAVLNIPAGRIQLIAADRPDTTVDVQPADPGRQRDARTAEHTTVTYADGVLHIHTADTHRTAGSLTITVQLPAGSHLEATTAAAELRTVGRLGDLTLTGAYHHITIDEAAAVRLTAVDGDIHIGRLTGPAEISTTRGDIRIGEATRGTVTLRTRSGDITIAAAPGVSATLDAGTGHGRTHNTLKNNGTPELDVHATTTHGDITARSL